MSISIDLSNLSVAELLEHRVEIDKAIEERTALEKEQVLEDMKALAADRGYDFSELVFGKKPRKKIKPKYANPKDSSQTWTGMGNKPKWIVKALEAGSKIEDFKI